MVIYFGILAIGIIIFTFLMHKKRSAKSSADDLLNNLSIDENPSEEQETSA